MSIENKSILKFVPGFIRNDFWRKVIALFFAILIWVRVSDQLGDEQIFRDLPISIDIPPAYVVVGDAPTTTDITLKGSKQRLLRLKPADLRVLIKISNPRLGENKITISNKDVLLPAGVSVERIERKRFSLVLDRKIAKKVPVRLNITGSLLDDYTYAVAAIIPAEVRLTGPESIIRRIKELQAAPIQLSKVNVEDFECTLDVRTVPNVSVSPKNVTVKVDIFKKFDSRTFESVPVRPFGFLPKSARSIEFDVKTVSVRVTGLKQAVELLTADDLHPFVDTSAFSDPGERTLEVRCWSSVKNVFVKEIKPKTITVIVK